MRSVQKRPPASFLSGSLLLLSATATIFSSDHFLPPAPPGPALVRLVRGGAGPAQDNAPPVPHHQPNTSDFCAWLFHPKFYRGGKSPKLQELSPPVADPSVVVAPMADPGSQPSLLATFCPSDHHRRLTTTPTRRPWSFSALERDMSPTSAPSRLLEKVWGGRGTKKAANHEAPAPAHPPPIQAAKNSVGERKNVVEAAAVRQPSLV